MNGALNYYFADEPAVLRCSGIFNSRAIFAANAAPYTTQTVCNDHVLPQGARLFSSPRTRTSAASTSPSTLPDGDADLRELRLQRSGRPALRSAARFDSPDPARAHAPLLRALQQRRGARRLARSRDGHARLAGAGQRRADDRTLHAGRLRGAARSARPAHGPATIATCDSAPGAGDGVVRRLSDHRRREHRERDVHPDRQLLRRSRPWRRGARRRAGDRRCPRALDVQRRRPAAADGVRRVARRPSPARRPRHDALTRSALARAT